MYNMSVYDGDIKRVFMKFLEEKKERNFVLITSVISFLLGLLYIWKGFEEGFLPVTIIVLSFCFLYIPAVMIFRRTGFIVYNLIYGIVLIFLIAFYKSLLFNNYTGLIAVFFLMIVIPKLKWISIICYGIAVCVAFALNDERLCPFFIHILRSTWLLYIFDFLIKERYSRKKLILYDDEILILKELSKNKLQKAIALEGFSESTIYRRLKAACERNNLSKNELIEAFKLEYDSTGSATNSPK